MEWSRLIEDIELELGIGPDSRGGLARLIEVRPGMISDIKAGKSKNPSADLALRLINRLGVSPRWLESYEGPILENGDNRPRKVNEVPFLGTIVPSERRNTSPEKEPEALFGEMSRRLVGNLKQGEKEGAVLFDPGAVYLNANGREIISDDFVAVSLLSQKVSAGPGQEVLDFDTPVSVIPILRRMLRGFDPKGAFGAEVDGDSMTGEKIFGGDIVIFYRGLVKDNGLYVLFRDGGLFVKRLTFSFTTKRIKITSANERYPEVEEVEDSQALTIAGKVLGWVHVHPY